MLAGLEEAFHADSAIPVPGDLVARERITRKLAMREGAPLRLLVAPAGYGKTTALRQWAERDPRPFAWVRAGSRTADPMRLLSVVVEALGDVGPVDADLRAALASRRPELEDVVLPRLARWLAAPVEPFVLVVDEAEVLEGPHTRAVLGALVGAVGPRSAVAIAARSEPPLPVGRLRAHRGVVELRARELAMTRGEARDMLAASGLRLDARQVDLLLRRTEGWPAGLLLAALAVKDEPDLEAALARFAGDDRLVADYLGDELLSRLAPDELAFLRRSSPLAELSGPLCDAALDRSGSGALLRDLARSHLLLAPLDRSEERFRCHHLLSDLLRAELRRTEPAREAELHRRASVWLEEHGEPEAAVEHALAAGDAGRAGALIWRLAPVWAAYGQSATLHAHLSRFDAGQLAEHPHLALTAALLHLTKGEGDRIEHWTNVAEARLPADTAARCASVEAGVAIMRAAVARAGLERMREDAARAYALESEPSPWRALSCLLEGASGVLAGDGGAGRARLEEAVRRGGMCAPGVQVLAHSYLALSALVDGDWEEGIRPAALARAQVERVGLQGYPTSALVYGVSALALARQGRVDAARRDAREAGRLLVALDGFSLHFVATTALVLAMTALRLGDTAGARDGLAQAARAARGVPDAVVLHLWLERERGRAEAIEEGAAPLALTAAELRVLQHLPTHLAFREIAGQLRVSTNTVKTQAHALYRKLDASSRSEAVARARRLALLDDGEAPIHPERMMSRPPRDGWDTATSRRRSAPSPQRKEPSCHSSDAAR